MTSNNEITLKLKILSWFFFISFFLFLVIFPGGHLYSKEKKSNPVVLTSIYPLYDFCRAISGEWLDIELLLPAGVSPHHWQPRFSDLIKLEKAAALVHIGPSLEPWVKDLIRMLKNRNLRMISFEDLCFLREEEGQLDPHIWLDFQLDIEIIHRLAQVFSELVPAVTHELKSRAEKYTDWLRELDVSYQKTLSSCRQRTIVIDGHGAFNYLVRRYKLKIISLHGLNPEAELRSTQIRQILELVSKEKVKTIFYESDANPKLAPLIKDKLGVKILPLYPGHSPIYNGRKEVSSFIDLMRKNLENLKEGLGCD